MRKGTPPQVKILQRMYQSEPPANPWFASIITRKLAHNKTHMRPKELCTGTCVISVSQRMEKKFNIFNIDALP